MNEDQIEHNVILNQAQSLNQNAADQPSHTLTKKRQAKQDSKSQAKVQQALLLNKQSSSNATPEQIISENMNQVSPDTQAAVTTQGTSGLSSRKKRQPVREKQRIQDKVLVATVSAGENDLLKGANLQPQFELEPQDMAENESFMNIRNNIIELTNGGGVPSKRQRTKTPASANKVIAVQSQVLDLSMKMNDNQSILQQADESQPAIPVKSCCSKLPLIKKDQTMESIEEQPSIKQVR